jgi:osmoprotectant transport system substrate-binding protein
MGTSWIRPRDRHALPGPFTGACAGTGASCAARALAALLLLAIFTAPVAPAGAQSAEKAAQAPVRVGSKIDTEGSLLGNLIIQALEARGIRTENRVQLGPTRIVRTALTAGEIDIYPEYTGNGAFFFSMEKDPAWRSAKAGYDKVKALDRERNALVWLTPAPANNTWAIAVRKDLAAANGLHTLQDLGRWIAGGGTFKLAASAEFVERPDALPAFQSAYGFKLRQDQLLTLAGGDTAVTIKAAAERTSGVNAAMAYGTDGPLATLGLVVLDDPKGIQPVYAPAPVIRAEVLARHPDIEALLAPVFQSLDGATLQSLNARIALGGEDAKQVAASYLKAKGLLK